MWMVESIFCCILLSNTLQLEWDQLMSYCWEPHHNLSLWCAEPGISMAKFHLCLLCCWMVQGKVTNTVLGSVHLVLSRESSQIFLRPCWCFNPWHNLLLSPGILKGLFCQRKQKKIKQTQPWDGLEKEVLCFPGSSNDFFFFLWWNKLLLETAGFWALEGLPLYDQWGNEMVQWSGRAADI